MSESVGIALLSIPISYPDNSGPEVFIMPNVKFKVIFK